jgi:hypothetical protein
MELTRTRNREHARSTRNRKKARYQELIDKESALDHYQQEKHLAVQRRSCIVEFLNLRQNMIRSPSSVDDDIKSAMTTFLGSSDDFQFCTEEEGANGASWFDHMRHFDVDLIQRASNRFGADAAEVISYAVAPERIAVSLDDKAYVPVNIVLETEPDVQLLSAHLVVTFISKSTKIRSISWHTIKDNIDIHAHEGERLRGQTSYPSVVSLDPSSETNSIKDATSERNGITDQLKTLLAVTEAECGGPGMTF